MLDEIVKDIRVICDYKVSEIAMLNILQAKLTQVMGFKSVRFQSIQNIGRFTPLAYFAFNFVPSGGAKNLPLITIDLHICKFFNDYLKKYNEDRLEKIQNDQILELQKITDKVELRRKKMEQDQEIKYFTPLKKEITNATQAKLYKSLEIIKEAKAGSILIVNTEFANFYEDAIMNKDKTKKEFCDMLFNLYDGEFQGTDTVSTSRENIDDISASCLFMSDYKLIMEIEKLVNAFKSFMARGMARRSFFYYQKNENYYNKQIAYPTADEKNAAIEDLHRHAEELKLIFDQVSDGKKYYFNQEANEEINRYKQEVDKKIAGFYKYTNVLNINQEILKLNIEHSTWKIIKLAVLYHILENPTSKFVTVENFKKATDFFNKTHICLENMLNDKLISDYDKLYNYLVENRNKFVSKMTLRNQNFVASRDFKNWFDDALTNISQMAEEKGFNIVSRVVGKRNQGFEVALYEPDKYRFDAEFDGNIQKGKLTKIDHSDLGVSTL